MPVEFFELPQGTPSVTAVVGSPTVGYCTPSDVASLNKARAAAWGTQGQVATTDVDGYILMVAGQIDAVLVNKGYSVPVNTASFPEVEGLLCYVNAQGAAWMVEEASPNSPNIDRVKTAFDAAMAMLASAKFTLDVPVDEARAEPRGPWVTFTPPDGVFDPQLRHLGGVAGDGISSGCVTNRRSLPFFSRGMQF